MEDEQQNIEQVDLENEESKQNSEENNAEEKNSGGILKDAARTIKEVVTGRILVNKYVQSQIGYFFLLFILAIGYIGYRYNIENTVRENRKLEVEIKALHAEYITKSMELVRISKRSEIMQQIQNRNLTVKEPKTPPTRINLK